MLIGTFKKLLKPLYYLRIKHDQKFIIDILLPVIIAAVALLLINNSPLQLKFVGNDGFVKFVNNLLQILVGFFVASLAAVATFQRSGMDEPMVGKCPTLNKKKVTRRQYLCYMFGYLSFMTISLYFIGGILELIMPTLKLMLGDLFNQFRQIGIFIYLSLVANIILTTMLALHFLTDRLVRDDEVKIEEDTSE